METKLIECKKIDVPKTGSESRTFSRDFAIKLADSIKIDGQLSAIVVRPNLAVPGRYILVAGRHRFYAMKSVLKEQFINATIVEGMDEEDAEFAGVVENLWRNPLSKAQNALAIKKWHDRWLAKHSVEETPAAAEEKLSGTSYQSTSDEPTEAAKDEDGRKNKEATERKFDSTVAAATGQSAEAVRKAKRVANAFTEDQLEVFAQMEVNQTDMTTVAKIKDVVKRGEVVNLIASGMVAEDAIKEVMKDAAPVRSNGRAKAENEAAAAAKEEVAPDLTDDEWFEQTCGEKAAMFKHPEKFKADALLYRAVTEIRHTFRVKSKKLVAATKKGGIFGGFTNLVNRFISISHPKDWLICPECKGSGEQDHNPIAGQPAPRCSKCFGGGYMLKVEEYL